MTGSRSLQRAGRPRGPGSRAWLLLALVMLLSGCLKYDLMLVVNENDKMDGTLIVAVAREFAVGEDVFGRTGELNPSEGTVTKEPYEDTDYVGSRYIISGVPISEINSLSTDSSTRFSLTREGEEFVLDATLNFNLPGADTLPTNTNFSAMVSFTFPGEVSESNGTNDGNTVVWNALRPDAANTLTARASAVPNGQAASALGASTPWWVWVLGGVGVLLVMGLLAAFVLRRRKAATAARTAAALGGWPALQPAAYDPHGQWIPEPGYVPESGYYDSGQDGEYGSYYGTYGDASGGSYGQPPSPYSGPADGSYADTYGGPPGTQPRPPDSYAQGGYSGQTVVGYPGTSSSPGDWRVPPPESD